MGNPSAKDYGKLSSQSGANSLGWGLKASAARGFADAMRSAFPGRHRQKTVQRMLAGHGVYPHASTVASWLAGDVLPAPEYLGLFIVEFGPALLSLVYGEPLRLHRERSHAEDSVGLGASALPRAFGPG